MYRIPHPTSNTLVMPMDIVFGCAPSSSGMMFSGLLTKKKRRYVKRGIKYRIKEWNKGGSTC